MSFKGLIYKFIMNTAGKDSKGIELANTYGLNSAELMDYIYRKSFTPSGKNFWGRWADNIFLSFPTWKSIRARKKNLQGILFNIINQRLSREPNRNIGILDLASGYSQYIFSVFDMLGEKAEKLYVEMHDNNASCEKYINSQNKQKYNVKFVCSDIINESEKDYSNTFDIIILTGFFDSMKMSSIDAIERTVKLAKNVLSADGLFIFSYQASHINSSLVNELFYDTNMEKLSMGERQKIDIQYVLSKFDLQYIGQISDDENRYPIVVSANSDVKIEFIEKMLINNIKVKK